MRRILFRMLLGMIAGLVAWALIEPTNPGIENPDALQQFEYHIVAALGIFSGLAIAGYNAYSVGGRLRMTLGWILGPLLGLVGALMGYGIGSMLQHAIFRETMEAMMMQNQFVPLYLSRIIALTPIGTMLGIAVGAASLDWRRVVHGAIGGTIGGAIGGMVFDPIAIVVGGAILAAKGTPPNVMDDVGTASRAVYFVVMAGCIALFIGIVEQVAKQASLRLALGRNEGRDYPLFGHRTLIGRNELAQVPIFNDPAVAPQHAFVDRRGPIYWVVDGGSGAPTFLNGQPVSAAPLDHGALIQVGNTVLQFLLKNLPMAAMPQAYGVPQQAGFAAHPAMQPQPVMQPQMPVMQPASPMAYQQVPTNQPTTVISPQPIATPTLVATDGPLAGQRFPIQGILEVGREAPGLPLRFDSSASRRHASISSGPAGLVVQDLGSTNGTFVNGQRVATATVRPGDLVKIGATTFRIE